MGELKLSSWKLQFCERARRRREIGIFAVTEVDVIVIDYRLNSCILHIKTPRTRISYYTYNRLIALYLQYFIRWAYIVEGILAFI